MHKLNLNDRCKNNIFMSKLITVSHNCKKYLPYDNLLCRLLCIAENEKIQKQFKNNTRRIKETD